jgi:hypothetical protein
MQITVVRRVPDQILLERIGRQAVRLNIRGE